MLKNPYFLINQPKPFLIWVSRDKGMARKTRLIQWRDLFFCLIVKVQPTTHIFLSAHKSDLSPRAIDSDFEYVLTLLIIVMMK